MAGIQGGTIGCHSIKTNPEFGLSSEDRKAMSGVINQKSSHFNSKIKTVENPEEVKKAFDGSFKPSKSQKVNQDPKRPKVRPRSETIDIAKAQAVKMRKELTKTRSRSSSVPPPIKPRNEKGGHSV